MSSTSDNSHSSTAASGAEIEPPMAGSFPLADRTKAYIEEKALGDFHEMMKDIKIPDFYVRVVNSYVEDTEKGLERAEKNLDGLQRRLDASDRMIIALDNKVKAFQGLVDGLEEKVKAFQTLVDGQAALIAELYRAAGLR